MTTLSSFSLLVFLVLFTVSGAAAQQTMEEYPIVKLRTLDKVSARTMTFEARVGSTVKFGPIFIKIQTCRKAPPIEQPEAAAFLQIWEVTPQEEARWIFSGWMFASSPALSSMDHPVYDVWVLDCLQHRTGEEQATEETEERIERAPPEAGEDTTAPYEDEIIDWEAAE